MVVSANMQAYRTRIINFRDHDQSDTLGFEYLDDGVLIVEDGQVKLLAPTEQLTQQGFNLDQCIHLPDWLCCPGFIDAHIHAGQLDVIASYGKQLLDWLEKYTFPAELKFADPNYAELHSQAFIDVLFRNGVTSALVFSTRFAHHTQALFEAAKQRNMRFIAGRVMMDRNAPSELCDTPVGGARECRRLIEQFHQNGRLGYAVTPRFAGTSTREQLIEAGKLFTAYPDLWMQTHLSENQQEVKWTGGLFPEASDYLNVYEMFGLVKARSIFAHCVHLSVSEKTRLQQSGASIAFCPSSNCFLGSGLFPYEEMKARKVPVALASDVGAGTSVSPFSTMADAYKVCQLQGYSMSPAEAFYLSTLGAARSLHIDRHIGSLSSGKEADFIFINGQRSAKVADKLKVCRNIEDELFAYIMLGDERIIERTYINGQQQFAQPAAY